MDRLALLGVSHRRGGLSALETWQAEGGAWALERLREAGVVERVPIVTCNRWDAVAVLPPGLELKEVREWLRLDGSGLKPYAYAGEGALEQLTRVAASLDSLNPGEDQIMAQVREAYRAAEAAGTTGRLTAFAFDTALRIAKRVRRELRLAPLNTSLFSLARPVLEPLLRPGDTVAVLGAGAMATLAAKSLRDLPGLRLLIANRDAERGARLALAVGGESLSLDAFLAAPDPAVRVLVGALAVGGAIEAGLLARLPRLELLIDLGLPQNLRAGAAAGRSLRVLNVDTLRAAGEARRRELGAELAAAEGLIQGELERALDAWTERELGPSIRQLRARYLHTIGQTVGSSLPLEEAERLAHRFAHLPVKGLRALARAYGLEAAQVFMNEVFEDPVFEDYRGVEAVSRDRTAREQAVLDDAGLGE